MKLLLPLDGKRPAELSVNADYCKVALKIQSQNGKTGTMVRMMTVTGKAQESAMVIFHRYGNQYFLAKAWVDGNNSGLQAQKPRGEPRAEHGLAGIKV